MNFESYLKATCNSELNLMHYCWVHIEIIKKLDFDFWAENYNWLNKL